VTDAPPPSSTGDRLLSVGRVIKPQGLGGETVVDLWSDQPSRLAPGTDLVTHGGLLRVASSRPHGHRYVVRFEGVNFLEEAEALRGTVLWAEPIEVEGALWVHELVGAEIRTTDGRPLGRIEDVEPNPASDLLVLTGGALVPVRFIVEHRPNEAVVVDVPDGLVD
jgi:16S rRNA processing protein RimM